MKNDHELDLIDAMVSIIRNPLVDLGIAYLAATVISIDANFNARVASVKNQNVSRGKMHDLLDFAEEVLVDARALAWAVEQGLASAEICKRLLALRSRISSYEM